MRETGLRDAGRAALAAAAAFLFYSLLGGLRPSVLFVFNAFSLVVMVFSIGRGEIFGAFLGAACGLVQDSFSAGIFGVAGLTKTLLGFGTGYVSKRIDVVSAWRNALFLCVMAALELLLWILLKALVLSEPVDFRHGLVFLQPFVTALLGTLILNFGRRLQARRARA